MEKKTNIRSVYRVVCKNNMQIQYFGFLEKLIQSNIYLKGMQYFSPH